MGLCRGLHYVGGAIGLIKGANRGLDYSSCGASRV